MIRCAPALLVLCTLAVSASRADAQWNPNTCWDNFCRDYHRNTAWPSPFLQPDRRSVELPFAIQTANGWRRQNLISDYHFSEDRPQMTLSGESKVRHILTQMPPSRRVIYVQRGMTPEVTATRIELVHRTAHRMGLAADVVESDLPNEGWPADAIDSVAKKGDATRPDPRLPDASGGSGTSSSGTSGR
jgi:hypothetical protein